MSDVMDFDFDLEAALLRVADDIQAAFCANVCSLVRRFEWDGERFVPLDFWLLSETQRDIENEKRPHISLDVRPQGVHASILP